MREQIRNQESDRNRTLRWVGFSLAIALLSALHVGQAWAQLTFDSGSTEVDGDLLFCQSSNEEIWDPQGLDADGDSVYEFGTITVPLDCTVRLSIENLGPKPVSWLASGPVVIDGTLDLSGAQGHSNVFGAIRSPAAPGPGGFAGGMGLVAGVGTLTSGFGPGGGAAHTNSGRGAGHITRGGSSSYPYNNTGGAVYGNAFLLPMVGGSGGGGAYYGGGGGGGGAILIASSDSISIDGSILADGGAGRDSSYDKGSGGGSGGAIRLVAPTVSGSGTLSVAGGTGSGTSYPSGAEGRIRSEAFDHQFTGSATTGAKSVTLASTTTLFSDLAIFPVLHIVTVDGQAAPLNPTGGLNPADVTINNPDPALIEIEAEGVPEGTEVTVEVHSESIGTASYSSTPLTLVNDVLTATATVPIDGGFSFVTLRADWGL